jgi:glycosyltransferase involved in cell wall biosynthesis
MDSHMMDVTVVIPTFNRKHLVTRAIDSVLAQTLPAREVVVVDDGSTDGTMAFLSRRYEGRQELKLLYQENAGSGKARNNGVNAALSQWVAFLDSDDEWYPFRLERMAEALAQSKGLDALATGMDENVRTLMQRPTDPPHVTDSYTLERLFLENGTSSCMAIRKECFKRLGGFCRPNNDNEDHDLVLRLLAAGGSFAVLQESLGLLHTEESRHSGDIGWWYDGVFSFWREKFNQYGFRGVKRRRALSSLYFDSSLSAWEKEYPLRSFRYLLMSFMHEPFPVCLARYGTWLRYRRLVRVIVSRCLWSSMWHVVVLRFRLRLHGGA